MVQDMPVVRAVIFRDGLSCFRDRLKSSDLVVDVHGRDQDRLVAQFPLQIFNINMSQGVHRKMRDPESCLLKHAQRLQYSGMLNGCGNDMIAGSSACHGSADQRPVIGFGPSGGKEDLGRRHTERRRDALFGLAKIHLSINALLMSGRRIAVVLPHRFLYDLKHALRYRSGRGIIQICFHSIHHFPGAASAWQGSPCLRYPSAGCGAPALCSRRQAPQAALSLFLQTRLPVR